MREVSRPRPSPDAEARHAPIPRERSRVSTRRNLAALLLGAIALVAGTSVGWSSQAATLLVAPPPLLRVAFGVIAVAIGVVLLFRSTDQLKAAGGPPSLVRGVRTAFLAVAAFAAAAGWIVGSPVPIVAALVIAGVDVLETTFLLVVAGARERQPSNARQTTDRG
jgi:uncharacterized membrane protein YfcA